MKMQIPKILGQNSLNAATLTLLYRVPGCAYALMDSLIICNRAGAATTFRVAVAPGGAADAPAHYIFYDAALGANETRSLLLDLKLAQTDELRVYSAGGSVSCSAFGTECH